MKVEQVSQSLLHLEPSSATKKVAVLIISFGLLSAITLPPVPFGGLSLYLVTLLSPAALFLAIFLWFKTPYIHSSSFFPIALGAMVCISAIASWTFKLSSINIRDIIEAVKYLQFFPFLFLIPFLKDESLEAFHKAVVLSSMVALIVGFSQVLGIANFISYLYLGNDSSHIDSVLSGHRITLTGSDPNIGGIIACFFSIYFFSLYSIHRRFGYLLVFLVFFYLCFLTQSRTALIAVLFGLGLYYVLFFRGMVIYKILSIFLASLLVVFLVFYLDLSYIYIGIQYALEGRNNSLNVRFENIYFAVQKFLEYPLLGVGPAKSSFDTTIDSEYALIIQRYGLVGIFVFAAYLVYLLRLALRNLGSPWGVSLFIFVLMSVLVMITNNIFSGYQLMSIIILLNIACVINERKMNRSSKELEF
ncbi:O-antigen ligase-like membrane protein [Marinobacter pelagius]|uniref:O-antigen ligase-like membrane protein n=1 Tax=Marinobacter pelagius TaxID=379482 RepID=A0A366G0N0_9GAMM|nr:O-antigen ligase family protein [Marinobacter pelagius]RBP20321.1 O-antigen ligase-like membrane protein [Marinobacter pelagius]